MMPLTALLLALELIVKVEILETDPLIRALPVPELIVRDGDKATTTTPDPPEPVKLLSAPAYRPPAPPPPPVFATPEDAATELLPPTAMALPALVPPIPLAEVPEVVPAPPPPEP